MEQHELRAWEAKCVQEEPPFCTAACPLHVDVRSFMALLAQGKWAEARKILEKTMPLPAVLGRLCDHPCQAVCKRAEAGDAVAVGALERACVERTGPGRVVKLPVRVKRTAAVLGGGFSGLTAAWDLARKGVEVTLYARPGRRGGRLLDLPASLLPPEALAAELSQLEKLGVRFEEAPALDQALLDDALTSQGAVYVDLESVSAAALGLETDAAGRALLDPVSLATNRPGVFAGGQPEDGAGAPSIMREAADGRRGAASIDRYLQGSSLSASREKEGAYATRLFTSVAGVAPAPRVAPAGPTGYDEAEAQAEAARCLLCECRECVKVCGYLANYKGYPKRYAREIYNNEAIVRGNRTANKLINSCSDCGLCAEVCPNRFHMGELCLSVRANMVRQGHMPLSAHEFALLDMEFSGSDKAAFWRHAPGSAASDWLFFPGCQLSGTAPAQVGRVYGFLRTRLGRVGYLARCCGAPAAWAGREDLFAENRQALLDQWRQAGEPRLILACSTCLEQFRERLPEISAVSLWEVLEETGLPEGPGAPATAPLALHDPCTTRHAPAVQAAVRRLAERAGLPLEELPFGREKTECCGYGGLMSCANPGLAKETAARRAAESPSDYLAYCAMCRDSLAATGKRVTHLLDWLFPAGGTADPAARPAVGFSARQEHRALVKETLLRELWNETSAEAEAFEKIRLRMTPEVRALLDGRRVLDRDVQRVILNAESTGRRFVDSCTGKRLAYLRPRRVTFWVEYSATDAPDEFVVHNAYSHRMVAPGAAPATGQEGKP